MFFTLKQNEYENKELKDIVWFWNCTDQHNQSKTPHHVVLVGIKEMVNLQKEQCC